VIVGKDNNDEMENNGNNISKEYKSTEYYEDPWDISIEHYEEDPISNHENASMEEEQSRAKMEDTVSCVE
jgi:hypothetical protein